jgi:type IV pilus assembly protein PilM
MTRGEPAKNKLSVGVDVGSHSIKVAVLGSSHGNPVLEAYNVRDFLPGEGKQDNIGGSVREVLSEIDINIVKVNLSISGPDVIVRFITLPKMTKEQLDAALVFEAEKYIPFNIREVVLDSVILGDAAETGQMRVLLAAAKRDLIEERVRIFAEAGMKVNFVDISAFSCFNAFISSSVSASKSVTALLDMGHSQTSIVISIDGTPFFTRQIQVGGREIDTLIARNLSISPEKAAEFKQGKGDFDTTAVSGCIRKVLDDIIREIQLSFGYFEGTCNHSIETMYCSGGLLYAPGVFDHLVEKIGADVRKWDPFQKIKISSSISKEDLDSISLRLAVSAGLALRD